MRSLTVISVVAVGLLFAGCPKKPDEWLGFVYPDRNDLTVHKVAGAFQDLDACLKAVNAQTPPNGAYECALNCKEKPGFTVKVCERTVGNERKPGY